MSRFVLTAQLQLQAPRNVNQVVNQIQRQLSGITVDLNVQNGRQASRQIADVNRQVDELNKGAKALGKNFGVSVKRFAAFSIANRAVSLFTNRLSAAIEESIDFQRELIKIKQVSGATDQALANLQRTITDLSTNLGTASKDLLATSRILAQTGLQAAQLEVALSALAKTTLAPTFENIEKTAEGAVAILAQFGQGVGALEDQLGAINAVAGQFAVESGDLISVVRRTGGVFKAAGGDLNELLGLFTSVRATTRESAESIATGLRTIFTRIQRPETIQFLKQFGVELTDLNGKFVGPFDAVRQLSQALKGLEEGDIRFVQIAEELGGFRQIGKVIPLLQQFETAERARQAAVAGAGSLDKDAATAQQALAVQMAKTRENFLSLIRSLADTTSFQVLVKTTLSLADALISVADALKPILPLMAAFAGIKIAKGLGSFAGAFRGSVTGRNAGGPIGFATGGVVPGTGNRDTVPAMLTPGEFVIRKSSVSKIGAGTLAQMNNNRYASGGTVRPKDSIGYVAAKQGETPESNLLSKSQEPLGVLKKKGIIPKGSKSLPDSHLVNVEIPYSKLAIKSPKEEDFAGSKATTLALNTIDEFLNAGKENSGFPKNPLSNISGDDKAKSSLNGYVFEQIVGKFAKTANNQPAEAKGGNTPFDFVGVASLGKSIEKTPVPKFLDAARTKKTDEDIKTKALNAVSKQGLKFTSSGFTQRRKKALGGLIQKFAAGGIVDFKKAGAAILDPDGQDSTTVPVSVDDVKKEFGRAATGAKFARGKDPFTNRFSKTNFKVTRQSLNAETSKTFRSALEDGMVAGLNTAGNVLGNDLGLGGVSLDESTKSNFIRSLRATQIGDAFENVVSLFENRGNFDSVTDPNRPFDFPNGLSGALKDNFDSLPSKFVDAKSSMEAGSIENLKGKILRQIKQELIVDGIYEDTPLFKAPRAKKPKKKATGGGIAGSDTVPAMLTPGEFVINSKSASSIGRANLDRMNKQGVVGFAKGGAVGGVQYLNKGGPSSSGGGGFDPINALFLVPTVIDSLASSVGGAEENLSELSTTSFSAAKAFNQFSNLTLLTGTALSLFGKNLKDLGPIIKTIARGGSSKKILPTMSSKRYGELGKSFNSGNMSNADFDEFMGERENRRTEANRRRNSAPIRTSRAIRGRLGGGRAANLIGRSAGGAVKAFGAIARFAGPIGIGVTAFGALNSIVKAGLNLQDKFNDAVKQGNVERIKELGVLKEAPALFSLFGENAAKVGINLASYFGGNTLASIEANANAQALAAKATKEFEENAKEQAKATKDLISGTRTAADVFKSGELTKNLKNAIDQGAAEIKAANTKIASDLNRFGGSFRNWLAETTGLGSTDEEIATKSIAAAKEVEEKAIANTSKQLDDLQDAISTYNKQTILAGGSFQDVISSIENEVGDFQGTLSPEKAEALGQAFQNQQKNIIDTLKVSRALNTSLFSLDSTVKSLNLSLSNNLAKITGDFDQFSASISAVEAVTNGAAVNTEDFSGNLNSIATTLKSFGASQKTIDETTGKFSDLNKVSSALPRVLAEQKANNPDFAANPQKFQEALGAALADELGENSKIGEVLRYQTEELFKDIDFSDLGADVSTQMNEVMARLSAGATVDIESLKRIDEAYSNQAKILQEVYNAEERVLEAKLASIEAEKGTAAILDEFGIASFNTAKRMELLQKRVDESVGKDVSTDGASLSQAISEASVKLQKAQRDLTDPANKAANKELRIEIDKQKDIIKAASQVAAEDIQIKRESLKLAKERLKLDREAIDALLVGDIETFLRKEESAGARQALTSGNTAALQEFSPRAIGEALKSITDVDEKRKAADTAVVSGAISQSMANVLTEDTPEIQGIREEVKAQAQVQEDAANALKASAESDLGNAREQKAGADQALTDAVSNIKLAVEANDASSKALDEKISGLQESLERTNEEIKKWTETIKQEEQKRKADLGAAAGGKARIEAAPSNFASKNDFSQEDIADIASGKQFSATFTPEQAQAIAKGEASVEDRLPTTEEQEKLNTVRGKLNQDIKERERQALERQQRARAMAYGRGTYNFSRGGSLPIYASRGRSIFKPRGTDTVPAMLSPGEYVVNRKGVERGDNKAVLSAMNRGATFTNGVYNNERGGGSAGIDTTALQNIASTLSTSFSKFSETVNRLINFKFEMTIAPTRVDVVINTPQAMNQMKDAAKEELLTAVVNEISINQLGKLRRNRNA